MSLSAAKTPSVFVSYSHTDRKWLERLKPYLEDLRLTSDVAYWDDTMMVAGRPWREELQKALDSATAAVLLVSQEFLVSKFIREIELPSLLAAAERRGCRIFPVIVSPCRFEEAAAISRFPAINDPGKPLTKITGGHYYREIYLKLIREIETPEKTAREPNNSDQGGVPDVYLAVPMSSVNIGEYSELRALTEMIVRALQERGLTVYSAALGVANPTRFSRSPDSEYTFEYTVSILSRSRVFMMIYPSQVASSALMEAGYALHQKIPSVYLVREGVHLPYLLESSTGLDFVEIVDYDSFSDVVSEALAACVAFLSSSRSSSSHAPLTKRI
jgi:hypothetical protein